MARTNRPSPRAQTSREALLELFSAAGHANVNSASCPQLRQAGSELYWIVSGYFDVRSVLRDARLFSSRAQAIGLEDSPFARESNIPFNLDPPLHLDYRRLIVPLLDREHARRSSPLIAACVDAAIASVARRKRFLAEMEFAVPLTANVLCRVMGFPEGVRREVATQLVELHGLSIFSDVEQDGGVLRAEDTRWTAKQFVRHRDAGVASYAQVEESVRTHIRSVSARNANGVVAELMALTWERSFGSRAEEATNIVMNLLLPGLANTAGIVAAALEHFGSSPADRERLIQDPALVEPAAHELLRLHSVSSPVRMVRRDHVLSGAEMHVGDRILALVRPANRDSSKFTAPNRMRFDRDPTLHLGFGSGRHLCPGRWLAIAVITASLRRVLREWPTYVFAKGEILLP